MIADYIQFVVFFALLAVTIRPLGLYVARVLDGSLSFGRWRMADWESWLLKALGFRTEIEMSWKQYCAAVVVFSSVSILILFLVQLLQGVLPFNPQSLPAVPADLALNTAVSFVTNTNWQAYGGESTLSYLTQMIGLTVQNFASAAVGISVMMALLRGFTCSQNATLGNFWIDLHRIVTFVLLPLSFALAIVLVSQGVVQTFSSYQKVILLEPTHDSVGNVIEHQTLAIGPVASQVAIKQLGTNGGGFFNANSAHPLENPTPLSNLLQLLAILVLPASLCVTFGELVRDRRQGWALLATMLVVFVPLCFLTYWAESRASTILTTIPSSSTAHAGSIQIANMEGKEVRFGVANSALWAVATTAASNGSVNAMLDSFTPIGGMFPMWLMQLGEVIFGGVGSGLYGLVVFAIISVFVAGLMVGRTPEYLGKKIEKFEMQMAMVAVILPCVCVLAGTALAVSTNAGRNAILNPGPHGFSEVLYALSSASNNNGSAFAGLGANVPFYNLLLALVMLVGRFGVIVPVLAIAGSLSAKKSVPQSSGTLQTHAPLFIVLLVSTVLVVGALSFFPALALGPIVEHVHAGSLLTK